MDARVEVGQALWQRLLQWGWGRLSGPGAPTQTRGVHPAPSNTSLLHLHREGRGGEGRGVAHIENTFIFYSFGRRDLSKQWIELGLGLMHHSEV